MEHYTKIIIKQMVFGFSLGIVLAMLGASTVDIKWWVSVAILNFIVAWEV